MPRSSPDNSCCPKTVQAFCDSANITFDHDKLHELTVYLSLLSKWNRVMNLVGQDAWEDILATLVTDSFYLAPFVSALKLPIHPQCWDLGAGAGLPGIPLRMLWKDGDYTLVEAREKRALFLRTVLASCPLEGVSVFHGRAERFMPGRPPAHLIVSRAFMPWEKLLTATKPYLASGGFCVLLTRTPLHSSLPDGWTAAAETRYAVTGNSRYFWALQKI
ncbi:MAG: 16S rRNA (guanine(527)-N(7))-methyltransferase RsmG [Desulfovibrio sp.]|jgi:16S rRNA (guanine527-N7)-methyltransferase|nr:16S rRNA (guanine(527)-N(7))-methyltransferase RsmG [Desulfovibrio sp.]